jgi:hypothetical protein
MTFWLALLNGVAWLAILATNYALIAHLLPVMGSIGARLDNEISPMMRLQLSWAHILRQYGLLTGVIISPLLVLLVRRQSKAGKLRRLVRRMAGWGCAGLVIMMIALVVNSHSLLSLWGGVDAWMEQTSNEGAESRALDSTRRVIIAEYRYRELHPDQGYTCDLDSLAALGGPAKGTLPNWKATEPSTISMDLYTLSLRSCQGQPVARYEVAAIPETEQSYKRIPAYCSDGSGALYLAADGKSETCLAARKPVH